MPTASSTFEIVRYARDRKGYQNTDTYDAERYEGAANEYKLRALSYACGKAVGDVSHKRLLDVGCGTGRGLGQFAGEAACVVGLDPSTDMLAVSSHKIRHAERAGLVAGVAQTLPFRDNQFDIVICLNCLHLFSLPTQRRFVEEMKRVVKPGCPIVLEFDNALHGAGLGLLKRKFRSERGMLPSEIRYVVGDRAHIDRAYGAVFPVVWRWFHRMPRLFFHVEKLACLSPISWLAARRFYRVIKTAHA
jgi:ubiquinone/menaquinone biosynthesis C-methylase UbiE